VDFDIAKEDWNEYKLEDETLLKIKFLLIKVVKSNEYDDVGNPVYSTNSQNIIGVFSPKHLRGTPDERKYSPEELSSSIVKEDLGFETIKENWNVYRLKDGTTLSIKLVLSSLSRTSKFDSRGEPIYIVQTQPIFKGKVPPQLKKKTIISVEKPSPYTT